MEIVSRVATLLTPSRSFAAARDEVTELVRDWWIRAGDARASENAPRLAAWWSRYAPGLLQEGRQRPELDVTNGAYLLENAVALAVSRVVEVAGNLREPHRSALLAVAQSGGADLLADLVRARLAGVKNDTLLACDRAFRAGHFPLPNRSVWVEGAEVNLL